jgi:hypothetical protein
LQRKLPNEPISIDPQSRQIKANQGCQKNFWSKRTGLFMSYTYRSGENVPRGKGGRRQDGTALAGVGLADEQLARPPAFPLPLRFLAGLNA